MTFRQELESERVRALPLRNAILVEPNTVVRAAIALMRTESLGCAIIANQDRIPSGIFTEQSVLEALVGDLDLDNHSVSEFADPHFVCVSQDDPIASVWDAIVKKGVRFVCVIDSEGKVIGISGQRGVAEYVADCYAKQVTVQRLGATPWISKREGA